MRVTYKDITRSWWSLLKRPTSGQLSIFYIISKESTMQVIKKILAVVFLVLLIAGILIGVGYINYVLTPNCPINTTCVSVVP